MSSKLILGTAQFGQDYGIKHDGQPSVEEIQRIAQVAWDRGIRTVHTSWQYNLPKECDDIFKEFEWINKSEDNPDLFYWGRPYGSRLGKSLYDLNEEHKAYSMIMIPINVLDSRFRTVWENKKGMVIARSVFLQGLLLMDELPQWLPVGAKTKILDFHVFCIKNHLRAHEAALGWVLGLDEIDKVIVGVNSVEQLEQILQVQPFKWDYDFSITDENVLDPRRWPV